jgi:hypothetical protein
MRRGTIANVREGRENIANVREGRGNTANVREGRGNTANVREEISCSDMTAGMNIQVFWNVKGSQRSTAWDRFQGRSCIRTAGLQPPHTQEILRQIKNLNKNFH